MVDILLFFFNDTATTEIYTLSLHDALPISDLDLVVGTAEVLQLAVPGVTHDVTGAVHPPTRLTVRAGDEPARSEEHTSELQSRQYLVCRLLLEKKKKQ